MAVSAGLKCILSFLTAIMGRRDCIAAPVILPLYMSSASGLFRSPVSRATVKLIWVSTADQKAKYVEKQDEAQAKNPALEKNVRHASLHRAVHLLHAK